MLTVRRFTRLAALLAFGGGHAAGQSLPATQPTPEAIVAELSERDTLSPDEALRLAEAMRSLDRVTEASATLDAALRSAAHDARLWRARVEIDLDIGRIAGAARSIEAARQALGGAPVLDYLSARVAAARENWLGRPTTRRFDQGTVGQFREGFLLARQNADGGFLCAGPDSALSLARRALDAGFVEPAAHFVHAEAWLGVDQPQAARAILDTQAAALQAADGERYWRLVGQAALRSKDVSGFLRGALALAERAGPEAGVERLRAYLTAARLFNQLGEAELYAACVERASRCQAQSAADLLALGDALWDIGRYEDAQHRYRQLLESDPLHPAQMRCLERLTPPE